MDNPLKPRVGMTFSSEALAYDFYNKYGGIVGFSIRRHTVHFCRKDKTVISQRTIVCNKQGHRKMDKRDMDTLKPRACTRTNCLARMAVSRLTNGLYECREFIEEHNHELHTPSTTHFMRSQRAISDLDGLAIELADGSGIKPRESFDLLGMQLGGKENIGFTKDDLKNYLRTKRQHDITYGDTGGLTSYFETQAMTNPSFTYFKQYDRFEQVTNIFWADPKMIVDYALFGDVVSFDTTFCTNKAYRPLAIFAGFNHHRGAVIFGAALLYDETTASFIWLFQKFLEAHGQKKPITIFTDQDSAMAAAITEVLPATWHGLCTWHLMQNGIRHHGNLMKEGSTFLRDLKRCIYEYIDEMEFENAWRKFRDDYPVQNTWWLEKIYGIKKKWARCYMKNTFTLGIRSTQLSESINADLKDYLKCTLDIPRFFEHFKRVVDSKREMELKAEFDARNKLPKDMGIKSPLLTQAGKIYTPRAYELFLDEYIWIGCCILKSRVEHDIFCQYVVVVVSAEGQLQSGEFTIMSIPSESSIACNCKRFETLGILCCHILSVFQALHVMSIPARYILSRWTRAARSLVVEDGNDKEVADDIRLDQRGRYRFLVPQYLRVIDQGTNTVEGFDILKNNVEMLSKQLEGLLMDGSTTDASVVCVEPIIPGQLKKKMDRKGGKRLKGWNERRRNHKRANRGQPSVLGISMPSTMTGLSDSFGSQGIQQQQISMPPPMAIPSSQASVSTPNLALDSSPMVGVSQASSSTFSLYTDFLQS